jgi:thymidylate synthase ThyX
MRAYLIEHEVSLGSTRLYIEGGTPQFIAGSFLRHRVGELTVTRNSRYVALLRRFGRHLFPPKNHIGQLLRDPALDWHRIRPVRK